MIGAGLIVTALLAAASAVPTPTFAPTTQPPEPAAAWGASQTTSAGGWYGGPAALTDAIAYPLLQAGVVANLPRRPTYGKLGFAAFTLGAPLNHLWHGHNGRAAVSLGIRLGSYAAAYGVVTVLGAHCWGEGPSGGCGVLLLAPLLVLGTMIADDAFLAREPTTPTARLSLSPGVSVARGGGALSLAGVF